MEVFEHLVARHDCFLLKKPQTNQFFLTSTILQKYHVTQAINKTAFSSQIRSKESSLVQQRPFLIKQERHICKAKGKRVCV